MAEQLNIFEVPAIRGQITGLPIPQDKAILYPMLIEPDHVASYHSYWSYSQETRNGWLFGVVRKVGFGSFNGTSLVYCQLTTGEIQEFGIFQLFPASEDDILRFWGEDALMGYRQLLEGRIK